VGAGGGGNDACPIKIKIKDIKGGGGVIILWKASPARRILSIVWLI